MAPVEQFALTADTTPNQRRAWASSSPFGWTNILHEHSPLRRCGRDTYATSRPRRNFPRFRSEISRRVRRSDFARARKPMQPTARTYGSPRCRQWQIPNPNRSDLISDPSRRSSAGHDTRNGQLDLPITGPLRWVGWLSSPSSASHNYCLVAARLQRPTGPFISIHDNNAVPRLLGCESCQ